MIACLLCMLHSQLLWSGRLYTFYTLPLSWTNVNPASKPLPQMQDTKCFAEKYPSIGSQLARALN